MPTSAPDPSLVDSVLIPAATGAVAATVTAWLRVREAIGKLRAERDEAHYSHRQAWYHNLLDAEVRVRGVRLRNEQPRATDSAGKQLTGPPAWLQMKDDLRRCVHGVVISGTEDAVDAARALGTAWDADPPNEQAARDALEKFVTAVRQDLGAPRPRP